MSEKIKLEISELEAEVTYSYEKLDRHGIEVELEKVVIPFLESEVNMLPVLTKFQKDYIIEQIVEDLRN